MKKQQYKVNSDQVNTNASQPQTGLGDGKRILTYDVNSFTPKPTIIDTSINQPAKIRVNKKSVKGKGFLDNDARYPRNFDLGVQPVCVINPNHPNIDLGGNGILGKRPAKGDKEGWKQYMTNMRAMKGKKSKGEGFGSDMDNFFGGDIKPPKLKRGKGFVQDCNNFFGCGIKKKRGKGLKGFFTETIPDNSKQILKTVANNTPYVGVVAPVAIDPQIDRLPIGGSIKRGKLVKGSKEARDFMASIRAKRNIKGGSFAPLGS